MAFDIDRYTATSTSVAWADLDFDQFETNPLTEDTLRSLRYMCDIEYHTVCYLRDLLVTPSHKEADVSAFMTMWNREEFWHGEALAAVLAKHGVTVADDAARADRRKADLSDLALAGDPVIGGRSDVGEFGVAGRVAEPFQHFGRRQLGDAEQVGGGPGRADIS